MEGILPLLAPVWMHMASEQTAWQTLFAEGLVLVPPLLAWVQHWEHLEAS